VYFCVGQSSKKMSAMRIRHKKLSCVLTVRERSLLKETKEVRERNLALLKELKETKNKLYAFQQEMRQKGRCGMLSMENVWYREAIDKKNIELEAVKEELCEKQKTLRRVLRLHDEREEELEVTVDELKMTKKTLCKTQKKLSLAESMIREKEEEAYVVMADNEETCEKLRETEERLTRVMSELLEKEDEVDEAMEEVDRLTDVIIAAGIDPEMIDTMAEESAERGEIED
jgi:chromosome segregation ATPase